MNKQEEQINDLREQDESEEGLAYTSPSLRSFQGCKVFLLAESRRVKNLSLDIAVWSKTTKKILDIARVVEAKAKAKVMLGHLELEHARELMSNYLEAIDEEKTIKNAFNKGVKLIRLLDKFSENYDESAESGSIMDSAVYSPHQLYVDTHVSGANIDDAS